MGVPTGAFKSQWGSIQPLSVGDYLAVPAPVATAKEIYLMPASVVDTFVGVGKDVAATQHLTQSDMVKVFKDKIVSEGREMYKSQPVPLRKAKLGEQINLGKKGSAPMIVTVNNNTSMVVHGEDELYILSEDKFTESYEPDGFEIEVKNPLDELLISQGFKFYRPKATRTRFVYQLTAADVELLP